jgi:hypothetical protein
LESQGYCKNCQKITVGNSRGAQHYCKICGTFTLKHRSEKLTKFVDNGYSAEYVVTTEKRVSTEKEIIEACNIDTNIWRIDRFEVGTSEGYRKDRKVEWEVLNGRVTRGSVSDSGKMLVVPLHTVRVWVSRKTQEIHGNILTDSFIARATKHSPKYKKIKYKPSREENLFELGLPDLQLGRLVAAEDAGFDIDPTMQIKKANIVVDKLIGYAENFNITKILFPVGNDFFDTNSAEMTTVKGTPQEDDVRWKRTYKLGCDFIVKTIDKLMQLAPVDVLIISGNHDADKIFHLGEYIHAWNHRNPNVFVDNRPMKRKYYAFGKDLVMLTHGYFEKNNKLDSLMAYEVPQLWANSIHREVHLGDLHHKVDMVVKTNELENGVVIRILRSLAHPSVWEFDKGLVGSLKAGEAFVWHENDGVIAQFTGKEK